MCYHGPVAYAGLSQGGKGWLPVIREKGSKGGIYQVMYISILAYKSLKSLCKRVRRFYSTFNTFQKSGRGLMGGAWSTTARHIY